MIPEICYVVECSAGDYESYHTWIAGIFLNLEDAEKLKNEIIEKIEIIKDISSPYDSEYFESLTIEQRSTIYYEWWHKKQQALEFNTAKVKVYPFNKPISSESTITDHDVRNGTEMSADTKVLGAGNFNKHWIEMLLKAKNPMEMIDELKER